MGLITNRKSPNELFKPYTSEEKGLLAKKYTPEQMKAVDAGEAAVTPEDLDRQGVIRTDLGALPYLDDLSVVQGMIDKRPEVDEPMDPNARLMTEDEAGKAWQDYLGKMLTDDGYEDPAEDDPDYEKKLRPNRIDLQRAFDEAPTHMGTNGPISPQTTMAPMVPKYSVREEESAAMKKLQVEEEPDPRDPDGVYDQLRKETGYTLDDILGFKPKILVKHRVVNQTRLGKVSSLYCLAIAGNGNGRLGLGQAKGQEMEEYAESC